MAHTTSRRRSHRRTALTARAVLAALVAGLGVTLLSLAPAPPAGAATGADALGPSASTTTWTVFVNGVWVDTTGTPVAQAPVSLTGTTVTVTTGTGRMTCALDRTARATCSPTAGLTVVRGGTYTVGVTGLPAGVVAGNVGAFTTLTTFPGPQCDPNHGGFVDPCMHVVTFTLANGGASTGADAASSTGPVSTASRTTSSLPVTAPLAADAIAAASPTAAPAPSTSSLTIVASGIGGSGPADLVISCASPVETHADVALSAAFAVRRPIVVGARTSAPVTVAGIAPNSTCTITGAPADARLTQVTGATPTTDASGAITGVTLSVPPGHAPAVGLTYTFTTVEGEPTVRAVGDAVGSTAVGGSAVDGGPAGKTVALRGATTAAPTVSAEPLSTMASTAALSHTSSSSTVLDLSAIGLALVGLVTGGLLLTHRRTSSDAS